MDFTKITEPTTNLGTINVSEANELSLVSLDIDNGNMLSLSDNNKINIMNSASMIIAKYLNISKITNLNIKMIDYDVAEYSGKIKNEIKYGLTPSETLCDENIITMSYQNKIISAFQFMDKKEYNRSSHSMIPNREKIKFSINIDNNENKTQLITEAIQTLNNLMNEIVTENWLSRTKDTKSYIMSKNYWEKNGISVSHKNFNRLFYPESIKTKIVNKIQKFLSDREDYERFGKNYKLTIILEGIPGTGKTSFIQAVANEFDLDIYHVTHNNEIKDNDLIHNIGTIKKEHFILFIEDFDKMFVEMDETTTETFSKNTSISFSAFTNVFDGSFSKQGMISFITTNDISKINETLKRSGRTDIIVKFDYYDEQQTRDFIKHCFKNIDQTVLTKIVDAFCKNVRNKKYTVSALSHFMFDYKDCPEEINNNIKKFDEVINQQTYGTKNVISHMI
jgi:ATP-dependent 26S proteasome regulatory subunit